MRMRSNPFSSLRSPAAASKSALRFSNIVTLFSDFAAWLALRSSGSALELFVNGFGDWKSPLIQHRAQHSSLGGLQFLRGLARTLAPRGVCFQYEYNSVGSASENHGIVGIGQRRDVHQNIIELRPQFRHSQAHAVGGQQILSLGGA